MFRRTLLPPSSGWNRKDWELNQCSLPTEVSPCIMFTFTVNSHPSKCKGKVVPVLNWASYHEEVWGSGGVTPRILNRGGEWSASRPGDRRLGGPQSQSRRCGEGKKPLSLLTIEPQSSSSTPGHYTDWATPAPDPYPSALFNRNPCQFRKRNTWSDFLTLHLWGTLCKKENENA
jgi:hypothetical protein